MVDPKSGSEADPVVFDQVLNEEIEHLQSGRKLVYESTRGNAYARAHESQLVGLCFSGGGIRSATFNLGVLQELARSGTLKHFHYLSTVSGGGYIGSWLSAWIHRAGLAEVTKGLEKEFEVNPKDEVHSKGQAGEKKRTWSPITFLRQYSNYLTPRTGFLSLDTWTAVVTYCRNLLLNLSILALAMSALLLVPRLFVQVALQAPSMSSLGSSWLIGTSVVLVVVAFLGTIASQRRRSDSHGRPAAARGPSTPWMVVVSLFLASTLIGLWIPSTLR